MIINVPTSNFYFGDNVNFYFYNYEEYCKEMYNIEQYAKSGNFEDIPNRLRRLFEGIINGIISFYSLEKFLTSSAKISEKLHVIKENLPIIDFSIIDNLRYVNSFCNKWSHVNSNKLDKIQNFEILNLLKNFQICIIYFLKKEENNVNNIEFKYLQDLYFSKDELENQKIISDEEYIKNKNYSENFIPDILVKEINVFDFLFKNKRKFKIPLYQRGYSWEKENIEDLFNDIKDRYFDETTHYFGVIACKLQPVKNFDFQEIKVIDGQQRLTTSILFVMVCYYFLKHHEYKFLDKMFSNIFNCLGDKKYFETIFDNPGASMQDNDSFKYILSLNWSKDKSANSNYQNNFNIFWDLLDNFYNNESDKKLEKIYDLLLAFLTKFTFALVDFNRNRISVKKELEIFENLNSKGKNLSLSDLVKNYIFNLCDEYTLNNEKIEIYFSNKIVSNLSNKGRKSSDELLTDFYSYLINYFKGKESRKGDLLRDFKKYVIVEMFKNLNINQDSDLNFGEYKKFIDYLSLFLRYGFIPIKFDQNLLSDFYILDLISLIQDKKKTPLYSLSFLLVEKYNDFINIDKVNKKNKLVIFKCFIFLFKILVGHFMIIGQGDSDFKRTVFEKINKIRNSIEDYSNVPNEIYLQLKQNLILNKIVGNEKFEEFKNIIDVDFISSKNDFILKSILLLVSYHLLSGSDPDNFKKEISLEHIMPRKLDDIWISDLKSWNIELKNETKEQIKEIANSYTNKLGNLSLISKDLNSKLNNKSFKDKLNCLNKQNFVPNLIWNKIDFLNVSDKDSWSFSDIDNRSQYLLSIIKEIFFKNN